MKKHFLFILVLIVCVASFTAACAAPAIKAGRFSAAPAIDGNLSEPCWEKEAAPAEIAGSEQTKALVGYDDDYLYVGFICRHRQPEQIKGAVLDRDGNIFGEDSVEVFLDPGTDGNSYYQFAVNCIGTQFDGVRRKDSQAFSTSWDGAWKAKAKKQKDGFAVEIAIPFRILQLGMGQEWSVNFCRNVSKPQENVSWTQLKDFHNPKKFGRLQGIHVPRYQTIMVDRIQPPETVVLGDNRFTVILHNQGDKARNLEGRIAFVGEYSQEFDFQNPDKPAGSVSCEAPGGGEKEITIPFVIGEQGKFAYKFSLYDPDAKMILYEEVFNCLIESPVFVKIVSKIVFPSEPLVIAGKVNMSSNRMDNTRLKMDVTRDAQVVKSFSFDGRALMDSPFYADVAGLSNGNYSVLFEFFAATNRLFFRADEFLKTQGY